MSADAESVCLPRAEQILRDHVEQAYAEARQLVFDVVEGPPPWAGLTPRQLASLRAFEEAEADLNTFRAQRTRDLQGSDEPG